MKNRIYLSLYLPDRTNDPCMYERILKELTDKQIVTPEQAGKIDRFEKTAPFSLHWELKTLLYLGVLLLNVGLGVLIYEHIDTLGHTVPLIMIGLVCAGCFYYVIRYRKPFSNGEVESATPYYDYVLLLGCLSFLLLEGYWQYQYRIFGERYGLATFIPMVLFFVLAYLFDNRGVLSLAITALASWLGITVTPQELLSRNDFNSATIIQTGVFLGVLLAAIVFTSERRDFKRHFSMTYLNFSVHLLMVSCLSGIITLDNWLVYVPLLALSVGSYLWLARQRQSFYLLVVAVVYAYIGLSYLFMKTFPRLILEAYLLYYLFSGAAVVVMLINHKKILKTQRL